MSDPSPVTTDPTFEREKWEADLRLREREIAIKERELNAKIVEQNRDRWRSPLVLVILGATVAAGGNAWLAWYNGSAQRELEQSRNAAQLTVEQSRTDGQRAIEEAKAEAARILDMIKTANPDKAAENLDFLLKAGLIENQTRRANLERFLEQRQKGTGPSLPLAEPSNRERAIAAIVAYRQAIQLDPRNALAYLNLGIGLEELASFDEALVSYRRALEIDPTLSDAKARLDRLLTTRREK